MEEERQGATRRRLTVRQAADQLGISVEAVRGRIKRGTLDHEREEDRVFVLLNDNEARPDDDQSETGRDQSTDRTTDQSRLVGHLEAEISYLREQLDAEREARTEERRRADTVIAQLTSRIPQLEAPSEAQEPQNEPESAESRSDRVETTEEPGEAQRPTGRRERRWWRRIFGG